MSISDFIQIVPLIRCILSRKKNFKPQAIVKIQGGLGNQMWQYAWGNGIGNESNLSVSYDLSWFKSAPQSRPLLLESTFPKIKLKEATPKDIRLYRCFFAYPANREYEYIDTFFTSQEPRYLGAYYHHSQYYESQGNSLQEIFTFDSNLVEGCKNMLKQICLCRMPIGIQVRRGDYVGSFFEVTTPQYFSRAIDRISRMLPSQPLHFFVFSDDIEWCRYFFSNIGHKFTFVADNADNPQADLFLLSNCAHFIISNSSFAWWAAWLSKRSDSKIVIMPDTWYAGDARMKGQKLAQSLKLENWLMLSS